MTHSGNQNKRLRPISLQRLKKILFFVKLNLRHFSSFFHLMNKKKFVKIILYLFNGLKRIFSNAKKT